MSETERERASEIHKKNEEIAQHHNDYALF